jgi:hypothetical protein
MVDSNPAPVSFAKRLEETAALDTPVRLVQPLVDALLADRTRADALQGMWLGHAVHPLLVMVPIGSWTSATVLDLIGGRDSRDAARKLVGLGVLAFPPAASSATSGSVSSTRSPTSRRSRCSRRPGRHAASRATCAGRCWGWPATRLSGSVASSAGT